MGNITCLIVSQSRKQKGDPINGHPMENLNMKVQNILPKDSVGNLYGFQRRKC
jgi:hypothetical protein